MNAHANDDFSLRYSLHSEVRVHQISLDHNGMIRLLATTDGKRKRESELKQQFQDPRVVTDVRKGNWFQMSDDLCCFISSLNPQLRLLSDSGKRWKAGVVISS